MELHMVHRNIHDEEVSEALEHENGLTVLGFKFQVISIFFVNTNCFDKLISLRLLGRTDQFILVWTLWQKLPRTFSQSQTQSSRKWISHAK